MGRIHREWGRRMQAWAFRARRSVRPLLTQTWESGYPTRGRLRCAVATAFRAFMDVFDMRSFAALPMKWCQASWTERFHSKAMVRGLLAIWLLAMIASMGCQSWIQRKKKEPFEKDLERIREKMKDPDRPRLIGEVAVGSGMVVHRFNSIGLVSNLPGTGGIVRPSPQREMIVDDLRRHDVPNPEEIIDSPSTATATVRIFSNPCDEKGDLLDVAVENSIESTATDLREGYLMPTFLRQFELQNGKNYSSNEKARAAGDLVILPASLTPDSKLDSLKGIVIGGANLMETHKLSIRLGKEYRHVLVVTAMEKAINRRFYFKDSTKQKSVATGKDDWQIEIQTVPKYKWDPAHYMSTVLSMGFHENEEEVAERVEGCRVLLRDRETARRAACELEAIGSDAAIDVLQAGLVNSDTEVRFHSAYSLAYLDRPESVSILKDIARYEAAFRPLCLIGLAVNECRDARQALDELLQEAEPELRYGAFCAIRHRDARDPIVNGESIGEAFQFVQVPSQIPMVAVSLEKKKEIVLFGGNAVVELVKELSPTPSLRMIPMSNGMVRLAKRHISGEILQAAVSSDLVSIVRGMSSIEGNYNDIVHILDQLGSSNQISIPVAVNPRPKAGRVYQRDAAEGEGNEQLNLEGDVLDVDRASHAETKGGNAWWSLPAWMSGSKSKEDEMFESLITEVAPSKGDDTKEMKEKD